MKNGRIDYAGDVDVFAITPSFSGDMTIRALKIYSGMQPGLKIYDSTGTTVLKDCRIDQAGMDRGRLACIITAQTGKTVYAEVRQLDNVIGGGYTMSAGATIEADNLYYVSGKVANKDGAPVPDVKISSPSGSTLSESTGIFTLEIPAGSYSIVPEKTGCTFTPPNFSITVPPPSGNHDFVAVCANTVSGRVLDDSGVGIAAVTITAQKGNQAALTTTTDNLGNYTFTGLVEGAYSVIASKNGYSFTPPMHSIQIPVDTSVPNFVGAIQPVGYSALGDVRDQFDGPLSGVTLTDDDGHTTVTDPQR